MALWRTCAHWRGRISRYDCSPTVPWSVFQCLSWRCSLKPRCLHNIKATIAKQLFGGKSNFLMKKTNRKHVYSSMSFHVFLCEFTAWTLDWILWRAASLVQTKVSRIPGYLFAAALEILLHQTGKPRSAQDMTQENWRRINEPPNDTVSRRLVRNRGRGALPAKFGLLYKLCLSLSGRIWGLSIDS